ncbi:ATP12 family chaperone protein [Pseudochrobactrum sp. XF203]|uniref:ATP12 family chaperone protein n=1 Tax=Pseudochrobactrum sp. XF203 TaxID=2879116 RepID=UPI001CE31076|nr:ATP12 family protein [Pseudochrobactrum sp. XF203]UCA44540.1 ATPase [Pseudochrobactrum sp. XF203]
MRNILEDIEQARLDHEAMLSDPDPVIRAQKQMLTPLPKRFYKDVTVGAYEAGGFAILLDGKLVNTPLRNKLVLPTEAAAQIVAEEFARQDTHINPADMPATRLVNTAIDGVAAETQAVLEEILRFAGTDLLCYRADSPKELVDRQREHWDPLLDWAATLGANFEVTEGLMHVAQPREALAAFGAHLRMVSDPVALAALHVMTTLCGSAITGLALFKGAINVDTAWKVAHVDEDWTIEQWGEDEEAQARRAWREREIRAADALVRAL